MSDANESQSQYRGATPGEVLDDYRRNSTHHGNDLDLLTQSMMLIEAGHYREAAMFANRVLPPSVVDDPSGEIDIAAAQAAFIAAAERARPLYEQAAFEIEGTVENSSTMTHYDVMLNMLKEDPNW